MPPRQRDERGRFIASSVQPEVPGSFDIETGDGSGNRITSQGEDSEEEGQTESVDLTAIQADETDNEEDSDLARTARGVRTTRMDERNVNEIRTGEGASSSRITEREAIPIFEGKPPKNLNLIFNTDKVAPCGYTQVEVSPPAEQAW